MCSVGLIIEGCCACVGAGSEWELSVLSAQLSWEPKDALNINVINFKNTSLNSLPGGTYSHKCEGNSANTPES